MATATPYNRLSAVERSIIHRLLKNGLQANFKVSVDDGEGYCLKYSSSMREIKDAIGSTDETLLHFTKEGDKGCRFNLIHGNNEDVISDCSENESTLIIEAGVQDIINNY